MVEISSAEDPLKNWQERFPLPDSLDDPNFVRWAVDLDRKSQLLLTRDLGVWQNAQDRIVDLDDMIQRMISTPLEVEEGRRNKLDTIIGILVTQRRPKHNSQGLTARNRGRLLRAGLDAFPPRSQR